MDNIKIIIKNTELSFKATGLYLCMYDIYQKNGIIFSNDIKQIKHKLVETQDSVKSAIDELLAFGYITRSEINENGKLSEYIYDMPQLEESKKDDIPKDFDKYQKLWESNIGLLSATSGMWLLDVANKIPYELFQEAIFEAYSRNSRTFSYVKGIIDNWICSGITTKEELLESRKIRNDKFEEATIKRIEKTPKYNKSNYINKGFTTVKDIQIDPKVSNFIKEKEIINNEKASTNINGFRSESEEKLRRYREQRANKRSI